MSNTGWKALDKALAPLYAKQEPHHFGSMISARLGGPDPLDGISAYDRDQPRPHWHLITYGYTDLHEKETPGTQNGYGFEMTMRLARPASPEPAPSPGLLKSLGQALRGKKPVGPHPPPTWCLNLLQNLARYVFQSGNVLMEGHYMDLNGPMCLDSDTQIRAVAFMRDPELCEEQETPNGRMVFRQLVGLTLDELRACKAWRTLDFLKILQEVVPLGITDLGRRSILEDPAVARRVAEGTARDGSSTGMLYVGGGGFRESAQQLHLVVEALVVEDLQAVLPNRILVGRPLTLQGPQASVMVLPESEFGWRQDDGDLILSLPEGAARALAAALRVKAGTYQVPEAPGLVVEVVPTPIKDNQGRVVRVVGE